MDVDDVGDVKKVGDVDVKSGSTSLEKIPSQELSGINGKSVFFFFADYFPMRSMHEIFAYMYLLSRTSNSWQWDFPYESSFG